MPAKNSININNALKTKRKKKDRAAVKRNIVKTVTKLLKLRRVSTALIVLTAMLSSVIIFVTIYSTQVGNFVISTSNAEHAIFVSESKDFPDDPLKNVLSAKGAKDLYNTTLSRINVDGVKQVDGTANTRFFFGYSFYLKNFADVMIDYAAVLTIEQTHANFERAVWIMVIETRDGVDTEKVYALRQTVGENVGKPENCLGFETTPFLSSNTVFNYEVNNFRKDEIVRYTVIMWLEGNDADCIDDIRTGSMRLELTFFSFR